MRDTGVQSLGSVLDFMRLIWAIGHGLQARSKRMEAAFGITGPQRLVIRVLARMPDASAGRLAEVLHLHPSTVTGILKRLQDRGLLSRVTDPNDARRVRLRLTALGRRMDALSAGTVEAAVRRTLRGVAPDKANATAEVLAVLGAELTGEQPRVGAAVTPPAVRRSATRRPRAGRG